MEMDTQEGNKNLYDFIYIDKNRLYSLVSQLTDKGLLTQQIINDGLIAKKSKAHSSQGHAEGSAGLSNLIKVGGKASHSYTDTGVQETVETIQHYFNTEYTAPIFLVEHLINSKLAKNTLDADYGHLVFISGKISIKDTSILENLYEPLAPKLRKNTKNLIPADEFRNTMNVMKNCPHLITFSIETENSKKAWSSLDKEYFLVNHIDLIAKYKFAISGVWKCLAILDKKPEESIGTEVNPEELSSQELMFANVQPHLQGMIGIKDSHYGITPIAIFRNLNVVGQ